MNTRFHRFLLAVALWATLCGRASAQPLISLQPQAILNLLLGSSATFQVGASSPATTNLQYQWFRNGVRIAGQTNSSLTINNAQATDCGAFTVRVNDGVGVVESETAGLTVNILNLVGDTLLNLLSLTNGQIRSANTGDINVFGAPDIVPGDPGGSTAWYYWTPLVSGVATFTTEGSDFDTVMGVYTGTAPSHLTAVPTAINNDDGGGYLSSRVAFKVSALTTYVIGVDGYFGAEGNVVLTWGVAVGDTLPTAAATLAAATSPPTNEVQLSSPWPGHNCDWLLDNIVMASNTNTLTITNLNDSTVGAYTARFTTANGTIAYARPTSLQLNTIQDGTTVTNSFAWNKFLDSANSAYAPSSTPQKMDGGGDTRGYSDSQVYSTKGNSDEPGEPIVCNQDGGSPSWYTYVTPSSGSLVINTAGSSFNTVLGIFVGSGNSFSTLTNIGCGYTTNYAADGQPIVTIPNVPAHQTNFIVVEGENGASGTVHLNIKLGAPVAIDNGPTNQFTIPGTNVTLSVSATGATPLSFAWQFNGTNIPGATNSILTLSNVETSFSGSYSVVVSNQISMASAQATVSVVEPPSILNEPSNQICCVGSIAVFNCAVTGDIPLIYQWQHAGTNLTTATNSSLTLSNVQMSDAGAYSCMVSNLTGVATTIPAMLTVAPATPSITWSSPAFLGYGSALTYSQLNATASVPGTFAYSPPTGTVLTVGTQTLAVAFTPTDSVDYSMVTNKVTIVVSPAPLTVTAVGRSKIYGQSVTFAGSEFTVIGLVNGDTVTGLTLASSGSAATATLSGSPYKIVPSAAIGLGLGNYSITYVTGALTVNPAPLTVTANNRSKSYGQLATFAGTEFTASGLVNGDNLGGVTLSSSGAQTTATVAGSPYNIVPSAAVGTGLGNYTITYASGTMSVSPAVLTITGNNRTKTYGQFVSFAGSEFTASGLANGDSVSGVSLSSSGSVSTATVTGSPYAVIASAAVGTGLGNYTISYANGTLTLDPAALTISANNRTKTYGQTVTFSGTEFAAIGLLNSDVISSVTLTSAGAAANASVAGLPYSIVPSNAVGAGLSNYTITYANGSLMVSPATLTITANNNTKTYGQTATFTGNEFATSGLINSDTVNSVTLSSTGSVATATVAGSPYAVSLSSPVGTGLNNYTIIFANGILTVSPATVTITADNRSKTYGQTVIFAGNEFSATGLLNSDIVEGVTLSSAGTSATATVAGSPYPIVPAAAVGSGLANYTLAYANGVLTVGTAASILTWSNLGSIVYGTPLSGTQLNAVASVPGTFAYIPTNGTVLDAGTSAVSVVFTPSDVSDYANATNSRSLLVLPAPLKVVTASASRTYGQGNPPFTGIITGVTNGDNITASYTTAATTNSRFGNYDIVPNLVDLNNRQSNYNVSLVNGTLAVTPAMPSVTWTNPAPMTYGAELTATQLNASASAPGIFSYNPASGTVLNTGTNWLSVTFTPADSTDYKSVNSAVPVIVTPACLTVTASSVNRPFATENPTFTGSITGLTNGDDVSAGYSSTATIASTVGTYPIVATLIDPNNRQTNYIVNLVNGILVVGHPSQVFNWTNPAPMTYGTQLTATQLNAVANIPGNYAYTPSNGAVLNTGTNMLAVIFTPADPVDYSAVTDLVSLVVVPAPLTVTAPTIERVYGQLNPVFVGFLNGVTNNDVANETYSCSATAASGVGTYSIIPVVLSGSDLTNYAITYVIGMLTVDPAGLSITASTSAKPYGQAVAFTGTEFTTSGLVNGDTVTSVTLNSLGAVTSATVAASPYNVTPSGASGSGLENYNITYVNGSLSVNPAILNIAANNLNKTYGQILLFAGTEFVATGLVNGDSVNSVTLTSPGSVTTASVLGSPYIILPTSATGIGLANYNINYINGVLSVSGAVPIVSWAEPETITYGVPLNSNRLNAAANVDGNFFYAPTNGSVLNSGTNILSVVFTPTDTADYATVTNSVKLIVSPAPLTITAADASRVYGHENPQFIGAIAGLTNGDNITADYICNATNTSTVGTYPIAPNLVDTGNRLTNYTVTLANGALTINQADPVVNWSNPVPIFSGTPLAADQLNASANLPGSFSFTPPIGSVLNVGSNMLSVVFTPDDSTNYATATDAVNLVVIAPQSVQTVQTTLQTSVQNGFFVLSWSTNALNATLETTTELLAEWVPVTNSIVDGDHFVVTANMTGVAAFFRLKP